MNYTNIMIKGIGIYHPENKVHNDFYIEHFKKQGKDIKGLLAALYRENRYIIDNDKENALTMAVESSKKAIQKANISASDLDMIVFVTETPEYTVPSNALILNNQLGAKNAHIVYDYNSNCTGLITAMDTVARYMKSNKRVNRALVVSSIFSSSMLNPENELTYPSMADGSSAIILEKVVEDKQRGFIDARYYTNTELWDKLLYPSAGFSNIHKEGTTESDKKLDFKQHSVDYLPGEWSALINKLLEEYDLEANDIDNYFFSQLNITQVLNTLDKMNVSHDKLPIVATKYGYTGASSPFMALYDTISEEGFVENKKYVFCSLAAGYSISVSLYIS